jgi:chromosome segregation ATPase
MVKTQAASQSRSDNAIARRAIDEIERIDKAAADKKREQLATLQEAIEAIDTRIGELQGQRRQIEAAIASITGKAVRGPRRNRSDLDEVRERVARWMAGHPGEKFKSSDIEREFPELAGTPISTFLKSLIKDGRVQVDTSNGIRRQTYFV